jgi:hypothetical protein
LAALCFAQVSFLDRAYWRARAELDGLGLDVWSRATLAEYDVAIGTEDRDYVWTFVLPSDLASSLRAQCVRPGKAIRPHDRPQIPDIGSSASRERVPHPEVATGCLIREVESVASDRKFVVLDGERLQLRIIQ